MYPVSAQCSGGVCSMNTAPRRPRCLVFASMAVTFRGFLAIALRLSATVGHKFFHLPAACNTGFRWRLPGYFFRYPVGAQVHHPGAQRTKCLSCHQKDIEKISSLRRDPNPKSQTGRFAPLSRHIRAAYLFSCKIYAGLDVAEITGCMPRPCPRSETTLRCDRTSGD